MIINNKRALAYTARCGKIEKINGADNIELMSVLGWKVITKIGEFQEGDLCVYFEIDSKLPEKEWSEFMAKKGYKVKTMKLGKFGVISQGLALPTNIFDVEIPTEEGVDVTDLLGVTYAVAEDNVRKKSDPNAKYKRMSARHPKLFSTRIVRWFMRRQWGMQFMFFFFGKKRDTPLSFPSFVSKTDEERCENQPWRLDDGQTYIATEKLDGTSCTYALERKRHNQFEFYVCSRNVRQRNENQKTYHDYNIYWDLAFKYNIEAHLKQFLVDNPKCDWVCIQGEGVGSVQKNPLKLKEDDLYIFNIIDSINGRWGSYEGKEIVEIWNMKWVPILGEVQMPKTMEELKQLATDKSALSPKVLREGVVYRSLDGKDSFKNVSREYLLKHNE